MYKPKQEHKHSFNHKCRYKLKQSISIDNKNLSFSLHTLCFPFIYTFSILLKLV